MASKHRQSGGAKRPAARGARGAHSGAEPWTCVLTVPSVDGELKATLSVPRSPLRLAEIVPLAQQLTNLGVERALVIEHEQGRDLSCRAGCGACCRQLVPVSGPEAFRIADALTALDEATRDTALARFDQAEAAIASSGMMSKLEALEEHGVAGQDLAALAAEYFACGIACPLLVDESCCLHAERPLVCRAFNVTTPPEWCADPTHHSVRHMPAPPLLSPSLAQLTAKLGGGDPALLSLGLAMRWVDAHAELGFRQWPGADLFRIWVRELGVRSAALG